VVFLIVIKFLIQFYFITENLAKVILPIVTIFLFKRIIIWYLSRFFLTNKSHRMMILKNHRMYYLLNHFNFFFDCFLGSFVCIVRMVKSAIAAIFFMPRLDYSIFGRFLEHTDMGFISYVTFIHMEVNQTHPIKLAFCELLEESLYLNDEDEELETKASKYVPRNLQARNRWFVAYTLIMNPFLKKKRKRYLASHRVLTKTESLEQFLKTHVIGLFSTNNTNNKLNKRRSRSTPCILDDSNFNTRTDDNDDTEVDNGERMFLSHKTSIRKVPPPIMPRKLRFLEANHSSSSTTTNDDLYQNVDANFHSTPSQSSILKPNKPYYLINSFRK
jgi:hypothetical protein